MVRKYVLFTLLAIAGLAVRAHAGDPVNAVARDSSYTQSMSTITVSSSAVTTIAASTGWREFYVGDPASPSTVFFRCDGSTANITTVGWWIPAGQQQRIETNNACNFQVEAGTAPVRLRTWTWQP